MPGRTLKTSSPQAIGVFAALQHPDMPVTPGMISTLEAILQPDIKMHERPVEKRIAFADESDIAAGQKMRRDGRFRIGVEAAQRLDIGGVAKMGFRGQGIEQRQLQACSSKPAIENGAGFSARAFLGEIGDDRNGGDDLRGLDGHKVGIAGAEADAVQAALC